MEVRRLGWHGLGSLATSFLIEGYRLLYMRFLILDSPSLLHVVPILTSHVARLMTVSASLLFVFRCMI
jgi:hypothetical protein